MSNILWKSFHLCFCRIKCLPTAISAPPAVDDEEEEEEEVVVGGGNNKAASNETNNTSAASTSLLKNFNSIYELTSSSVASTSKSQMTCSTSEDFFSSDDDADDTDSVPDFSTIYASQRFFFSSPGSSNSIIGSADAPTSEPAEDALATGGGVAVQTYSPDPYADFRRSMQEMVEARELTDVKANWEVLHELLLCYLTLNPKNTHKFIVNAFADLVISLMSSSPTTTDAGCSSIHEGHRSHFPCTPSSKGLV